MSVTARWRGAVGDREAGAVAVVVAICSVLLFAVAALVIDIGSAYAKRRAVQTTADLAVLAGAAGLPDTGKAFDLAYEYLKKNLPTVTDPSDVLAAKTSPVWTDGVEDNGEIAISAANTRIRVVVPERHVDFGFAAVLPGGGFDSTKITAAATAEIQSPGVSMPFYLPAGQDSGYTCLKDTSGGGGPSSSPMRAALLAQPGARAPQVTSTSPSPLSTAGGQTLTVNGDNFRNPAPDVFSVTIDGAAVAFSVDSKSKITVTSTPAHAAGSATLAVTNADGTATFTLTYAAPAPPGTPTVTSVSPASGPVTGGTVVTVTGTNLAGATVVAFGTVPATSFTVVSATSITATSPPGTAAVHVRVTGPGGTSAETDDDVFTYLVDECAGTNGQFGFLDIPRSTEPDPAGANALVTVNTIKGIDHGWSLFPTAKLPPLGDDCVDRGDPVDGAVLDEDPDGVDGSNCIDLQPGNKTPNVGEAFLDGYAHPSGDLDPRLEDPPDGHDTGTLHGRTGLDVDSITDYLTVPLTTFVAALASGATPNPSMIDPDIVDCPRFALVPVINVTSSSGNGYYPVVGYKAVYVEEFVPNATGSQMSAMKAYTFDLEYLPEIFSSGSTGGTVPYIGAGPKVPVLVHDAGDPSY